MFKRNSRLYLDDIKTAIDKIEKYTAGLSFEEFIQNIMAIDAVIRNLTVIGEAAKNITADFKKIHTAVEWKKITGLRDKITHQYFGINRDIVWDAVKNKAPELAGRIDKIPA